MFNPMQGVADAIFKDELEAVREYAYQPFSVTAHAKTGCITLNWEGQEETYSVKWKKKSDTEYNYRQVTGRTSDFNGLENYQPYLFSVAGTYNGTVSEYTQEITAEPVDWATDPNNPDNAVNKAIAARTPKYLGVVETVPANKTAVITKGERLGAVDANAGDWVLMSKTVGGWKCGVCYRWTGGRWEPLTPEKNYGEHYHACILHICEIEELMKETGHFGALFAKALVTQKALIDDLAANQAFIKQLIVQRLKIDSDRNSDKDFEAWFDETHGLKIKNKGQEIFNVDNAGNVFAKNAFLQNGTFTGDIYSGPLELSSKEPASKPIMLKKDERIEDFKERLYQDYPSFNFVKTFDCISVEGVQNIIKFTLYTATLVLDLFFKDGTSKRYTERITIEQDTILRSVKGAKTLCIKNLPTIKSTVKGIVWVDPDGYLRIS